MSCPDIMARSRGKISWSDGVARDSQKAAEKQTKNSYRPQGRDISANHTVSPFGNVVAMPLLWDGRYRNRLLQE